MVMRSRRLEDLLGGRLDALTYTAIAELVGNADAAEREDLDYKQAHYSTDDKGKEELAKDIAAFANHTGGVLILGMAEAKGVPTKVMDVDLDDRHLRHIRQVIASNTAPPAPYDAIPVPNPENPGGGFLLLTVPRSPLGPHAVTAPPTKASKDTLRYPRRGGSKTDWLTETDIATAYRARFASAADRDQRLADVEEEIVDALIGSNAPHLIVSLVPEVPGQMTIDSAHFARYKDELRSTEFYLGQGQPLARDTLIGARRLVVYEERNRSTAVGAELHRDGSAAIAHPLKRNRTPYVGQDDQVLHLVDATEAVYYLMCAVRFLATHARDRTAASGTAQIKAVLVDAMFSHPTQRLNLDINRPAPTPITVTFIRPTTGEHLPVGTQGEGGLERVGRRPGELAVRGVGPLPGVVGGHPGGVRARLRCRPVRAGRRRRQLHPVGRRTGCRPSTRPVGSRA